MAPINLPDGTEVSEVILPDGSTASEVLAPDGSAVFGAIPDSVVDNFESGDLSRRTRTGWSQLDGSISNFAVNTNQPFEGSFAAEHQTGTDAIKIDTTLYETPRTLQAHINPNGGDVGFGLINNSTNDGRLLRLQAGVDLVTYNIDGGSLGDFVSVENGVGLSNSYHILRIEYDSGTYNYTLIDPADGSVLSTLSDSSSDNPDTVMIRAADDNTVADLVEFV